MNIEEKIENECLNKLQLDLKESKLLKEFAFKQIKMYVKGECTEEEFENLKIYIKSNR